MKMKKIGLFLLAGLLAMAPVSAQAKTYSGASNWRVSFTGEKNMSSNFTTRDLTEAAAGLQPGDKINFAVRVRNDYSQATDWYMKNEIRQSLEDASSTAAGGAYSYKLSYTDKNGKKTVLFDSDEIGGEDVSAAGEGLNEATSGLEEYFYLDKLAPGQSGKVNLRVSLEGETQGNDYQDTLAKLNLSFAVEIDENPTVELEEPGVPLDTLPGTPADVTHPDAVKTGDETQPAAYYAMMAAAGVILLLLGIRNLRRNQREREEDA